MQKSTCVFDSEKVKKNFSRNRVRNLAGLLATIEVFVLSGYSESEDEVIFYALSSDKKRGVQLQISTNKDEFSHQLEDLIGNMVNYCGFDENYDCAIKNLSQYSVMDSRKNIFLTQKIVFDCYDSSLGNLNGHEIPSGKVLNCSLDFESDSPPKVNDKGNDKYINFYEEFMIGLAMNTNLSDAILQNSLELDGYSG